MQSRSTSPHGVTRRWLHVFVMTLVTCALIVACDDSATPSNEDTILINDTAQGDTTGDTTTDDTTGVDTTTSDTADTVEPPDTVMPDVPPTGCTVDCDCPQGEVCTAGGTCVAVVDPVYCCDNVGCPAGEACVGTDGATGVCPECLNACDCPQGVACVDGACDPQAPPAFCCDNAACPPGQACVDSQGQSSTCARACEVDCDCPQGQVCTASGQCLQTVEPVYCCSLAGCPAGESCSDVDGAPGMCPDACGNGVIDPGEACDGDCPTSCPMPDACTAAVLVGDPTTCSARCQLAEISDCVNGDGCCPNGCSNQDDNDCSATCGNGNLDPGETCDGNCPVTCPDDGVACTNDVLVGSASNCTAACTHPPRTTCVDNDGCCPTGCTDQTDNDCSSACGNGNLDSGETCDGNCPTTCPDDGDVCTDDFVSGSAATCNAQCVHPPKSCQDADGCCPSSCSSATDSDCPPPSGDIGSGCTTSSDCDDFCLSGWTDGYCSASCTADADCGSGSHCVADNGGAVCAVSCTSSAQCRSGYGCADRDNDGRNECVPLGNGPGGIGAACDDTSDCSGGARTLCADNPDWYEGFCSLVCSSTQGCPIGTHCAFDSSGPGACLPDCSTDSDCTRFGYGCRDFDGDSTLECAPTGAGNGDVGDPCVGVYECSGGSDAMCFKDGTNGFPGGYCSVTCDFFFGVCPSGSHCAFDASSGTIGGFCVDTCTTSGECRAGYSCSDAQSEILGDPVDECWPN